ncbi:hypothetical protein C8Q80DRAFT_302501 [Daedaleopsis nitida]|nr:hypothetical protein C8Q80DRAFT_302501 [Daedaleopsis nitida]
MKRRLRSKPRRKAPRSPTATPSTDLLRAPVASLPIELLAHIFVLCSVRAPDTDYWLWWMANPTYSVQKTTWIRFRLVCRYWREVADTTPALWRSVDVVESSRPPY